MIKFLFFLFLFTPFVQAKNLATISYSANKKPVTISISLKDFKKTYYSLRKIAPNTPPAKQFFEDYLRYRIGVEEAYNTKSLVKNSSIRNFFANPLLRESFEQMLYKALADKKLKNKISKLDVKARKLSKSTMLKFYKKNPEFDIHFIVINIPPEGRPQQIQEARTRANKIYKNVKNSRKSFPDLVDLYSDDRLNGRLNIPRSRNTLYPTIYKKLFSMKNGSISKPITTPNGIYIIKLNRKVPFGEANRTRIKAVYFDQKRSKMLNNYFNSLKSKYKININKSLLKTVH